MSSAKILIVLLSLLLLAGCGGTSNGSNSKSSSNSVATSSSSQASTANTSGGGSTGSTSTTTASSRVPTLTIQTSGSKKVRVNVEVATTPTELEKGLMNRTAMGENHGMLFVFPVEQQLSFWMKDTLIPLSVAFINSNGRIVDIQDMQPQDLTSHLSAKPAQYALEVNQGFFEKRGVKVGDSVDLPR